MSGIDLAIVAIGDVDESFSASDLKEFMQQYAPYGASDYHVPEVRSLEGFVNMPNNDSNSIGSETMMDIEVAVSLAYPLKTQVIGFRSGSIVNMTGDLYSPIFQHLIDDYDCDSRPKVLAISYAGAEFEHTAEEANTMCDNAKKLVDLGTTIVMSSSNDGVANDDGDCPNGEQRQKDGFSRCMLTHFAPAGKFAPAWPSVCPYILSVGCECRC